MRKNSTEKASAFFRSLVMPCIVLGVMAMAASVNMLASMAFHVPDEDKE